VFNTDVPATSETGPFSVRALEPTKWRFPPRETRLATVAAGLASRVAPDARLSVPVPRGPAVTLLPTPLGVELKPMANPVSAATK
jgi:hypothetical protein